MAIILPPATELQGTAHIKQSVGGNLVDLVTNAVIASAGFPPVFTDSAGGVVLGSTTGVHIEFVGPDLNIVSGFPSGTEVTGFTVMSGTHAQVKVSGLHINVGDVTNGLFFGDATFLANAVVSYKYDYSGSAQGDAVVGTAFADVLEGNGGKDTLQGGGGKDTIKGGADGDTLKGDAGVDTIKGEAGNDKIWGGADGDKIYGGAGVDTLRGEGGNDTFFFARGDTGKTDATRDLIVGFESGHDQISLKAIDADGKGNDTAFDWSVHAKFDGHGHEVRWEQHDAKGTANDYTLIQADVDGLHGADLQIELSGLVNLHKRDFIL